jgi:branched-chain amino acid transport system substrate-binding protein
MPRNRILVALLAAGGLALSACGAAGSGGGDDILVGSLNPMTGPSGKSGTNALRGHELAIKEINAAGGIKSLDGKKLKLVNGDSQSNPATGRTETTRMIDEGVSVVMGAFESSVTLDASLVAERAGVPFIDPTAVSDALLTRGLKTFIMTQIPSSKAYGLQIEYLPVLIESMGLEKARVALLYDSTAFGQSVSDVQRKGIEKLDNVEIVADAAYQANTNDVSSKLAAIKAAKPDILLDTSYVTDAIAIAKNMKRLGMDDVVQLSAGGGIWEKAYVDALGGDLIENKLTMNTWSADVTPAGQRFAEEYEKAYGEPPTANAASTYMTTYFFAAALEKAASTEADKVLKALRTVSYTDLAESGQVMQYGLEIDPKTGENLDATALITQFQGGKSVTVWPVDSATTKLQLPH